MVNLTLPDYSWMDADPIGDFRRAQTETQDVFSRKLENMFSSQAMPTKLDMLKEQLLAQQLGNQGLQAELPYRGPAAAARLEQQQMANEMTQQKMPFNIPMMEAALRQAQLRNQQSQYDIQNAPQEMELKQAMLNLKKQQLEQELNPREFDFLQDSTGAAKQVAIATWLREQGREREAAMVEKGMGGAGNSLATWKSLPLSNRRDIIAGARGLGYDEAEAVNLLAQGNSLNDLAQMKGISPENLEHYERIYGPSPQAINAAQQRQAAEVELDYLGNEFTNMIEPYVDPLAIGGYSASQVIDAVKGQNKEQQAQFLAGTILYKDLAMLRNRLGMGENGITAIQEMEKASLGNIKPFSKLVDKEIFVRMNEIVNEKLKKASQLANKSIFNPERLAEERRKESEESSKNTEKSDLSELSTEEILKMLGE